MAPRDIEVALLRLDDQNPRHEHGQTPSEQELIADLFKGIDGPKMAKLAEHIAANGMSPTDNIMVIPNGDGSFTVVEGNRRLASVKLLADPTLAPAKYAATFSRLKGVGLTVWAVDGPCTRSSRVVMDASIAYSAQTCSEAGLSVRARRCPFTKGRALTAKANRDPRAIYRGRGRGSPRVMPSVK
jgi:hypothetical protein